MTRLRREGPPPGVVAVNDSRRLDIQGLRAIAVLTVVAFHAGLPVPGGFVGVDVFFVISGFVITAMLRREWDQTGRIRFRRFYWRRFKRLTPGLALMVAVTTLIATLVLPPFETQEIAAKSAIGAILLAANWVIASSTGGYFDPPAETNPLLNTWSLSVEEQFYLAFPALLALGWWLVARRRGRMWPSIGLVATVTLVSLAFTLRGDAIGLFAPDSWLLGFYSPVTRAWEFGTGAFLALCVPWIRTRGRRLAWAFGFAGIALVATSLWTISGQTLFPSKWTLLPVVGTTLLLLAGIFPGNLVSRLLGTRPMVVLGDWSYSLYLWHWPLIVFAGVLWPGSEIALVAAAAVSFAPAAASYRWVEQPIRLLSIPHVRGGVGLVSAAVATPLVIAFALWFSTTNGFWSETIRNLQADVARGHLGAVAGCDQAVAQSERPREACWWNSNAGGAPIFLVGDSNADHFSEGIVAAGIRLDRPVNISTSNTCLFILAYARTEGGPWSPERCRKYTDKSLAWLASQAPGDVIVSQTGSYWSFAGTAVGPTVDSMTSDRTRKKLALTTGWVALARKIKAQGHRVHFVQEVPKHLASGFVDASACPTVSVLFDRCGFGTPRALIERNQGHVWEAQRAIGRRARANVIDAVEWFCPTDTCLTVKGGTYLYRDAGHISVAASEDLEGIFADALSASESSTSPR